VTIDRLAWLILLAANSAVAAPRHDSHCSGLTYENHNQIDPAPLVVQQVAGFVADPQSVRIPGACIGVFDHAGHSLISTAETDENGSFVIPSLPPGEYRLIAKYDSLCPANVRLKLVKKRSKRRLQVEMKVRGIDVCSYVKLSKG
jgi:hypothetical protein